MASSGQRFVTRHEIVLEIHNLRASPKRKEKESSFAVRDPLAILFRFHGPSGSRVSAPIFFQATFVRQAKSKTVQRFRCVFEFFMPAVERNCVTIMSNVKRDIEASIR